MRCADARVRTVESKHKYEFKRVYRRTQRGSEYSKCNLLINEIWSSCIGSYKNYCLLVYDIVESGRKLTNISEWCGICTHTYIRTTYARAHTHAHTYARARTHTHTLRYWNSLWSKSLADVPVFSCQLCVRKFTSLSCLCDLLSPPPPNLFCGLNLFELAFGVFAD
jgi:hypothetical protein